MIPLGTKMGLHIINDKLMMSPDAVALKTEIETNYLKALRNDHDALVQENGKQGMMNKVFFVLNSGIMGFFDMGTKNKNKAQRQ